MEVKNVMRYCIKGAPITVIVAVVFFGLFGLALSYPFAASIVLLALGSVAVSVVVGHFMDDFR